MAYIVGQDNKEIQQQDSVLTEKQGETVEQESIIEVEAIEIAFDTFTDFKLAIKDIEEREEKERQERIKAWNQSYGYGCYRDGEYPVNEGDYRTVFFYEWSNVNSLPKRFSKVSDFQKWADENKIFISDASVKEMKTHLDNYCVCPKEKNTILLKHSISALKEAFNKLYSDEEKNKDKTEDKAPLNTYGPPLGRQYSKYGPYDDYDEAYWEEHYGRNCGWY